MILVTKNQVSITKITDIDKTFKDWENILFHHLAIPYQSQFIGLEIGDMSIAQITTTVELFRSQSVQITAERKICHRYKAPQLEDSLIDVETSSFLSSSNSKNSIWSKKYLSSFFSSSCISSVMFSSFEIKK
jgi:hypothetical protein